MSGKKDGSCILLTGGAGYVGSHTLVEVLNAGYSAVVVDNLCNSNRESLNRVEKLTGKKILFYQVDISDKKSLVDIFRKHTFEGVIHFAGFKAVGESCEKPLDYYTNNVLGTLVLLEVMKSHGVFNIIFSSSCTVYGNPTKLPILEDSQTGCCTNPYGRTKYFIEQIIIDLCDAEKEWNAVLLRYFNPVGCHKSGLIGDDQQGPNNNLFPCIAQVAIGQRSHLTVFGNDYKTKDGTGVRDYIHVVDVALGHVASLKKLEDKCGCKAYNLGTGNGYSVLDIVSAFVKVSGVEIPIKIVARRKGDADSVFAVASLALQELGWSASRQLDEMCEDTWRWQTMNPTGYRNTLENNNLPVTEEFV